MTTKQLQFTGGIFYNESRQLNRVVATDGPDYAGFPSEEIDAAWHTILTRMYSGIKTAEDTQKS